MATRRCIWPLLGQFSGSWPLAAIRAGQPGAVPAPRDLLCCNVTVTAVAGWRPALAAGGNGCLRVAVLRREHAGMARWA
jgi:hypothetical protein